jgi:hypothetical protein
VKTFGQRSVPEEVDNNTLALWASQVVEERPVVRQREGGDCREPTAGSRDRGPGVGDCLWKSVQRTDLHRLAVWTPPVSRGRLRRPIAEELGRSLTCGGLSRLLDMPTEGLFLLHVRRGQTGFKPSNSRSARGADYPHCWGTGNRGGRHPRRRRNREICFKGHWLTPKAIAHG